MRKNKRPNKLSKSPVWESDNLKHTTEWQILNGMHIKTDNTSNPDYGLYLKAILQQYLFPLIITALSYSMFFMCTSTFMYPYSAHSVVHLSQFWFHKLMKAPGSLVQFNSILL